MMLCRSVLDGFLRSPTSLCKYPIVVHRLHVSSRSPVVWKQVEQQVLNAPSVSEISSIVRCLTADQLKERDIFSNVGWALCDRVKLLVDGVSTGAEVLEIARAVPAGSLDVLGGATLSKVQLTPQEFVQFCHILSLRCSEDFTYDLSCLQPFIDKLAEDNSSISRQEYVQFLDSVACLCDGIGALDVSRLLASSVRQCIADQHDPEVQISILRLFKAYHMQQSLSEAQEKLRATLCAALTTSLWHLQPHHWVVILQCLDHPELARTYGGLVGLCLSSVQERIGDLPTPHVNALLCLVHVPLERCGPSLLAQLAGRLSSADSAQVVRILQRLLKANAALGDPIVAAVSERVTNVTIEKVDLMKLIHALAGLTLVKLQGTQIAKLVSVVSCSLWQQSSSFLCSLYDACIIVDFGSRTGAVIPPALTSAAMNHLLTDKHSLQLGLQQVFAGLLLLERSDGRALSRCVRQLEVIAGEVHLERSVFHPDLLACIVRVFSKLGHNLGFWLSDSASYAETVLGTLLSSHEGCALVGNLLVLLVQNREECCARFVESVVVCLSDTTLSLPVSLSHLQEGENVAYEQWKLSFSFLVTLLWAAAHTRAFYEHLFYLVRHQATVAAVSSADISTVRRLAEIGALVARAGPFFVLEGRAQDACRQRLLAEVAETSVRRQECQASLLQWTAGRPFCAHLNVVTRFGIRADAVLLPRHVDIRDVGGADCLAPGPRSLLCCIVDDAYLPGSVRSVATSRHVALAATGCSVVHVSWRQWKHTPARQFWQTTLRAAAVW